MFKGIRWCSPSVTKSSIRIDEPNRYGVLIWYLKNETNRALAPADFVCRRNNHEHTLGSPRTRTLAGWARKRCHSQLVDAQFTFGPIWLGRGLSESSCLKVAVGKQLSAVAAEIGSSPSTMKNAAAPNPSLTRDGAREDGHELTMTFALVARGG